MTAWVDFVRSAHAISVGDWQIQPSEFWAMSIQEWWWVFDHKHRQSERIKSRMNNGTEFSEDDWERARAEHREKMNGRA